MSSDKKEVLTDSKEDTENGKKESSSKKTLSLNLSVDVSKVLERKEKKIRGGTTVEVKASKIKEPLEIKEKAKVEESVELKADNLSVAEVKPSTLTEHEKSLRLQVLELSDSEENKKPSADKVSSSFRPVYKETPVETSIPKIEEKAPEVFEAEVISPVMSKPVAAAKEFKEDEDISNANKKGKKKTSEEGQSKKPKLHNLKNLNIAAIVKDEDEDEDEDEGVETETETEVEEVAAVRPVHVAVKVEERTPKFSYAARRKNKRRDANIQKVKLLKEVEVSGSLSVSVLAVKLAEKSRTLIQQLSKLGIQAKDDTVLDLETIEILVVELGHKLKIIDLSAIEKELVLIEDKEEDLIVKYPVVTIMGHVDHGKTTLLDTIRKTNVVGKESGGITQHIGAYQIKVEEDKYITFLDTPGHEAFSQIRARGSKITDIVVLVVAADDGVKQQTVEAINHAKLAGVPIILAINKIDKPEKNPQKVKTELLQHNIVVEEMGGDVLVVEISAKSNIGIDKLLETILLQAEVLDLKTSLKSPSKGSIIEVKVQKGFGTLATVLVERGVIKVGDIFVSGLSMGKIKVMMNDKGERLKEATPSMPVEISGFDTIVEAGDDFIIVPSEAKAAELLSYRLEQHKKIKPVSKGLSYFLSDNIENIKTLPLVIKADTQGSLEAIIGSLNKIEHKDLEIKVIHSGVGEINESDVMLTSTAKGVIIGFNSRANSKARDIAKKEDVDIRYHSIIYNLIDDIKLILSGLLDPNIVEKIIGYAEVREVFNITKVGKIAGCYVTEGVLKRSAYVRLLRENVVVHSGVLSQLKRFKDDAKEVSYTYECGVQIENYSDIKIGDMVECFEKTEVREKIE